MGWVGCHAPTHPRTHRVAAPPRTHALTHPRTHPPTHSLTVWQRQKYCLCSQIRSPPHWVHISGRWPCSHFLGPGPHTDGGGGGGGSDHTLTHTLTHTLIRTLTHTLTFIMHTLTHTLIHTLTHTYTHLYNHTYIHTLTHTLIHTLHTLTHTLTFTIMLSMVVRADTTPTTLLAQTLLPSVGATLWDVTAILE